MLGYVVEPVDPGFFKHFRGRDITAAIYLHYKKLAWYGEDTGGGLPPYPLVKDISSKDLEYLTQFLDYYHAGSSKDGVTNMGRIVGHLVEFKEQQDSGVTEWRMPKEKEK